MFHAFNVNLWMLIIVIIVINDMFEIRKARAIDAHIAIQ